MTTIHCADDQWDKVDAHLGQWDMRVWRWVTLGDGLYYGLVELTHCESSSKSFSTVGCDTMDELIETILDIREDTVNIFKDTTLFPYLNGDMLGEKPVVMTIKNCVLIDIPSKGGAKEEKPVLYFSGSKKGLVLNKTNARALERLLGPETDDWKGAKVYLRKEYISAFGDSHMAVVRIGDSHPPAPKAKKATRAPKKDAPSVPAATQLVIDGEQVALLDD